MAFVKAGEESRDVRREVENGILSMSRDRKLSLYLEKQIFPQCIFSTTLRPDILLVSELTKNIIMMEVTVQRMDRLGEAHECKMALDMKR